MLYIIEKKNTIIVCLGFGANAYLSSLPIKHIKNI